MAAFHLGIGLWNLRMCARIARYDGLTLSDVFTRWTGGIDLGASYSGVYIKAVERLWAGLFQIGMIFFFIIIGVASILLNRRNRRILEYVESTEKGR